MGLFVCQILMPKKAPKKQIVKQEFLGIDSTIDLYVMSLTVNGETKSSVDQNLVEAIKSLRPLKYGTACVFRLEYQGKASEKIVLYARQARLVFDRKMRAELLIRNLIATLK